MVSFSSRISLLIFLFWWPMYWWWGVLKTPTTTVLESICAFKSFYVCLMKSGALTLDAYRLIIVNFLFMYCPFYYYEVSLYASFDKYKFEVYFVWCEYCYSCLFSGAIGLV
jgi:hypothetical protein